jgi:hypothetical protein
MHLTDGSGGSGSATLVISIISCTSNSFRIRILLKVSDPTRSGSTTLLVADTKEDDCMWNRTFNKKTSRSIVSKYTKEEKYYFRCEYVALFAQDRRRPAAGPLWSTKAIQGTTTTLYSTEYLHWLVLYQTF